MQSPNDIPPSAAGAAPAGDSPVGSPRGEPPPEPRPTATATVTGRRRRATRSSVLLADRLATGIITGGGVMVVGAVLLIGVFLVGQVAPLFSGAEVTALPPAKPAGFPAGEDVLFADFDEHLTQIAVLGRDGVLRIVAGLAKERADGPESLSAAPVATVPVFPADRKVTAVARSASGGHTAVAFEDGSLKFGKIDFKTEVLPRDAAPPEAHALAVGGRTVVAGRVVERLPGDLWRTVEPVVEMKDVAGLRDADGPGNHPVAAMDVRASAVLIGAGGEALLISVTEKKPLVGKPRTIQTSRPLALKSRTAPPKFVQMDEFETRLFVGWADGIVQRYDIRSGGGKLVETFRATESGNTLNDMRFLVGGQSLATCDSAGAVTVWFTVPAEGESGSATPADVQPTGEPAATPDGYRTVAAHRLAPQGSAVTAATASPRDKTLVTGAADGSVWMRYSTSEKTLAALEGVKGPVRAVSVSPRNDALLALGSDGRLHVWRLANAFPEVTFATVFTPVWYEGYPRPKGMTDCTWQTTVNAGGEAKFSLVPLIFGTLKGTIYAMLLAVPLAVGAALYTSEFLSPSMRSAIKPGIEMMASLPSVVLGFIAALVAAPFIEESLLGVLLVPVLCPLGCMVAGHLWQGLPQEAIKGLGRSDPLTGAFLLFAAALGWGLSAAGSWDTAVPAVAGAALLLGLCVMARGNGPLPAVVPLVLLCAWVALRLGPTAEAWLLGGDYRAWLERRTGTGRPLTAVLALPFAAALAWVLVRRFVEPLLPGGRSRGVPRPVAAAAEVLKLGAVAVAAVVLSAAAAYAVDAAGWDLRGPLLGTYAQRNTLVVSFLMGFAVIPIIYTISEDAMNAVPEHLRSASLACGATPWQTAIRVVLPTAMSGIFSAVMVGLGRAVGETMIVVMATGNTPLIDVNPFNGFKALSAAIAVELPEAERGGTLYRMLFLAGLTLFVMTFVINTAAEIVRERFRRRAFQL
jgi:phosphate transport system permease protein